jgi:hypothetical protein
VEGEEGGAPKGKLRSRYQKAGGGSSPVGAGRTSRAIRSREFVVSATAK